MVDGLNLGRSATVGFLDCCN